MSETERPLSPPIHTGLPKVESAPVAALPNFIRLPSPFRITYPLLSGVIAIERATSCPGRYCIDTFASVDGSVADPNL